MFLENREEQELLIKKILNFMLYEFDTKKYPEWKNLINNLFENPKKVHPKDLRTFLDDHICPQMCSFQSDDIELYPAEKRDQEGKVIISTERLTAMIKNYLIRLGDV